MTSPMQDKLQNVVFILLKIGPAKDKPKDGQNTH